MYLRPIKNSFPAESQKPCSSRSICPLSDFSLRVISYACQRLRNGTSPVHETMIFRSLVNGPFHSLLSFHCKQKRRVPGNAPLFFTVSLSIILSAVLPYRNKAIGFLKDLTGHLPAVLIILLTIAVISHGGIDIITTRRIDEGRVFQNLNLRIA